MKVNVDVRVTAPTGFGKGIFIDAVERLFRQHFKTGPSESRRSGGFSKLSESPYEMATFGADVTKVPNGD